MRRHPLLISIVAAMIAGASVTLSADKVTLRSGKTVSGSFMGADVKTVRLLLANGSIAEFPVEDVSALAFSPRKEPPPPAPNPARAPDPITLPSGTVLNVLLTQDIDVDVAQAGMTFKALLDDPVMVGGKVIVPRNSAVVLQAAKVEQAGKMKGADPGRAERGGRRQEDHAKSGRRRRPWGDHRRDRRRRHWRGDRRRGGRRDGSDHFEPGHGALEAPRRNPAAVHAQRGGHRPGVAPRGNDLCGSLSVASAAWLS